MRGAVFFCIFSVGVSSALAFACSGNNVISIAGPDAGGDVSSATPIADTGLDAMATSDTNVPLFDAGPVCTDPAHCVLQIAAGGRHVCALMSDHTIECWGANNAGQLGSTDDGGALVSKPNPTGVVGISNATQISASSFSMNYSVTCALLSDAGVDCWGNNNYAQLGLSAEAGVSDSDPHPVPSPVRGLGPSTRIDTSNLESCAVVTGGALSCWGNNSIPGSNVTAGSLGRGTLPYDALTGPAGKAGTDGGSISAVQAIVGYDFAGAITPTGHVLTWGFEENASLGRSYPTNPDPAAGDVGISGATQGQAGNDYACVVASGTVWCWGNNANGELGRGLVGGTGKPGAISITNKTPIQVAAGSTHAFAVMADGSIYGWGDNTNGECGLGPTNASPAPATCETPVAISGLNGKAIAVTSGNTFACALIEGGTVQCWGGNSDGELGIGSLDDLPHYTPTPVKF